MAEAKTKPTSVSLEAFLERAIDPARHADCQVLAEMMKKATGEKATMWGESIVGFGRYLLTYADGRVAEWPLVGFSPRKNDLAIYIMPGFERYESLLAKLGKHKTAKVCLYVKKLADVDADVLNEIIVSSVNAMDTKRVRRTAG
jgi:Domain of unknown function (DU1801)